VQLGWVTVRVRDLLPGPLSSHSTVTVIGAPRLEIVWVLMMIVPAKHKKGDQEQSPMGFLYVKPYTLLHS
jgi:hypothetical protein